MKTTGRKTVWEGRFIRAVTLTYKDHSGTSRNWEAVERVNCDGIVAIVPVTKDNNFILIRQFRPVVDNFVIEFPAGLNDRDESHEAAAKRELIEETGHAADEFLFLAEGPISSGLSTEMLTVFLARDVIEASPQLRQQYPSDESENIEIIEVPVEKYYGILETYRGNGDYIDVKIYGLAELAKQKLGVKSQGVEESRTKNSLTPNSPTP